MKIIKLNGSEIFDSSGLPTLACRVILEDGISVVGSVPSGISIGMYEACELRDGGTRLFGQGVLKAIENLDSIIGPSLIGKYPDVMQADLLMLQLDGTDRKVRLGSNTLLAVSIALARSQAFSENMEPFELIAELLGNTSVTIPFPMVNIFSGGKHASNGLFVQEMMIVPIGAQSYRMASEIIAMVTQEVENILKQRAIPYSMSAEGAFAPLISSEIAALDILMQALDTYGKNTCVIGLDVAASHFYDRDHGLYQWHDELINSNELIAVYKDFLSQYPIYSIEDGMDENDITGWATLKQALGGKIEIVGDDLFATNVERIREGIELNIASAAVIKPNQIGTVSEALDAINFAKKNGMNTVVSHRSRETSDSFIVDFAVGASSGQVKLGGFRGERMAKYNRLLLIEEMLMNNMLF